MTLTLVSSVQQDLDGFELDARQAALFPGDPLAVLRDSIAAGLPITARYRGRVIGFGGLQLIWPGRAVAWCFLGADIPKAAWVPLTRAVRQVLALFDVRRVEIDVRADFWPAHRWAFRLGFKCEGAMEAYWMDGATYLRFARITA